MTQRSEVIYRVVKNLYAHTLGKNLTVTEKAVLVKNGKAEGDDGYLDEVKPLAEAKEEAPKKNDDPKPISSKTKFIDAGKPEEVQANFLDDEFMLDDIFEEQDYESLNGKRVIINKFQPAPLQKLDYRQYPSNTWNYFFFFIIHFFYYNIFGPVLAIFFIFTKPMINLCYNMHVVRFSWHSLEGLVCAALTYLLIICSERNNDENSSDPDRQNDETYTIALYNKVMIYFLRCIIVANKYSSLGDAKMDQFWYRAIPNDELKSQQNLDTWAVQSPETVFKNIYIAEEVCMIDKANCYVSFMTEPNATLASYLKQIEELEDSLLEKTCIKKQGPKKPFEAPKDMKYDDKEKYKVILDSADKNTLQIKSEKTDTKIRFYRMSTIMYYLINRYNNGFINKWGFWVIAAAIAILRGWLTNFLILQNKEFFYGQSGLEVFTMILHNLHQVYVYYIIARMIIQLISDFGREFYMQQELESLIEPYRVYTDKFLPTINFLDPNSAATWLKIKKVVSNYGHQFRQRNLALIVGLNAYMVLIYIFRWMTELGLIKLGKSVDADLSPFLNIDYVVFTFLNMGILFYLARLNEFNENHVMDTMRIKDFLEELQGYARHFFGVGTTKVSLSKYQEDVVYGETPVTTLYKAHLKKVRETAAPEQIPDYIGESLKAWGTTNTAVLKIKSQGAIMVLGSVVKPAMVTKLATVVGIAIVRVIQQWILGNPNEASEQDDSSGNTSGDNTDTAADDTNSGE